MLDFYQPTLLFRQNAIRRFGVDPEVDSFRSPRLPNLENGKDTQVLSQVCGLDRVDINSSYWKIPDDNMHLTAIATYRDLVAVLSGRDHLNLFLYHLDAEAANLSHLSTVLLAQTHSLCWIPLGKDRLLATGNGKGYAHLVEVGEDDEAFISKRFNHRKHLDSRHHLMKPVTHLSQFSIDNDHLISIYNHHLFYWDMRALALQMKPTPVLIALIGGLAGVDPMPNNDCVVLLCGTFGVSLLDLRELPKFQIPQTASLQRHQIGALVVKWNPEGSNTFALAHRDDVVRLWDIRKDGCIGNLHGHIGAVTDIEWTRGDLFTGGIDGNLIHWDLTSDPSNFTNCTLKQGLGSVEFDPKTNSIAETMSQRQCGTVLPASNTNIIAMAPVGDEDDAMVTTIDGLGFLGVHTRTTTAEKIFYTDRDLALLGYALESLADTLVEQENNEFEFKDTHQMVELMKSEGDGQMEREENSQFPLIAVKKPRGPVNFANLVDTLTEDAMYQHNLLMSTINLPTSNMFSDADTALTVLLDIEYPYAQLAC